ncbi:uncharacterized protein [Branchiostoma lanceolatum]|uniref:uncharacterized protein isoform X2 n=1 Tax=Branchiostoma lanceolatum TaxID=7740 RepID=UPI0034554F08
MTMSTANIRNVTCDIYHNVHAKRRVWRSSHFFEDWLLFREKMSLEVTKNGDYKSPGMRKFTLWLFNADKGEDLRFLVADLPGGLWKEWSSPDSGKSSPVPFPSFPGGGDTGEENRPQSPAALLDRGDDTNPDPDPGDESDDTLDNYLSDQQLTGPEETDSPTLSISQTSSLTTVTAMGSSESLYSVTGSDSDPSDHPESSTPSGPAAEGSPAEEEGIPRWMLNDLQVAADERGYRVNLSEGHLRGGFGLVLFGSVGAKRLLRHREVMDAAVHNGHNKVAFKIIQHSFMLEGKTIKDESQMSSIKAEMKVLERTRTKPHVNLLNMYDVWINQLIVVLVCPKAERFDLSYYVERNKPCCCLSRQRCTCTTGLPEGIVRALFSQIIHGLRYLHRKGIYHRLWFGDQVPATSWSLQDQKRRCGNSSEHLPGGPAGTALFTGAG